jgi:hypothetical protein
MGSLLFDLGDQDVADHDLGHPLGEFEDIFSHPVRRPLIGGKRLVRAVKHADGDQHVRSAIEQIVAPEPLQLSHHGHEALLYASSKLLRRVASDIVLSDTDEHVPTPTVNRQQWCSIA